MVTYLLLKGCGRVIAIHKVNGVQVDSSDLKNYFIRNSNVLKIIENAIARANAMEVAS